MTVLDELIAVSQKLQLNQIKNSIYISDLLYEAKDLLFNDDNLVWGSYDKNYLNELDKKPEEKLRKIFLFSNGLKKINKNYLNLILEKIDSEIYRINGIELKDINELKILNKIIPNFWISLLKKGFSRPYLFKILMSWVANTHIDFNEFFSRVKSLDTKHEEDFTIIFAIKGIGDDIKIHNKDVIILQNEEIKKISEHSEVCVKFFKVKDGKFISLCTKALDYYSAVMMVKPILNSELDIMHYSKPNFYPKIYPSVLVIGANNPEKANLQNFYYQIEGFYKHSVNVYESVSKKLNNLEVKKIHPSAVEKVRAGLMYYRLGCESNELHSKLLNYWIGMEFIFSAYESSENTIPRLKKYYSKMHGLLLFKRILLSFHSNIQNLEVASHFVNYKLDDIEYLIDKDNYDNAIGLMKTHPLFAYRAKMIMELFDDPKRISKMVHKSLDNMKRNLTRIYRIRNEIVHNASSISGMETVVSHMKFYLLFTIYSVIQFFDERADDFNFDGRIDIDDFFEIRELKFDNMFPKSDTNIEIEKLKLLKMPVEELFYPRS
jgi:hypothetical protein